MADVAPLQKISFKYALPPPPPPLLTIRLLLFPSFYVNLDNSSAPTLRLLADRYAAFRDTCYVAM